ncbi:MAG: rubrerythrin [Ignavibacteriae bacterium]|nr:MAG: rubrerythrin [Ignavibacteriota bacterium]
MEQFKSVEGILDFAITLEQEAVDFYTELAGKMSNNEMKTIFIQFSFEEVGHKAKLQRIKDEKMFFLSDEIIADLKLSDYVDSARPAPNMKYEDALKLAMKREKAAFKLYTNLADKAEDSNIKKLFLLLAQEESKHKLRFEIEYDEYVMKEN